ncbi:MAG: sigma-70 family RNA polymerase sigma factor [Planctomycetota bacterium]
MMRSRQSDARNPMHETSFPNEETTSPTLLVAVRAGDTAAWHRLVRIYGPLLVSWCRRCGLQESDAFDVSQDVLVGLNQSLDRFEHRIATPEKENKRSRIPVAGAQDRQPNHEARGSFRGWLWTITRNKIADHRRGQFGKASGSGGTGALQQLLSLPDDSPESTDDIADLHLRALAELKLDFGESTWTAFWRVVVEGDAAKDVGEDLGISVWAVYKAKSRILAKLQEEFGEEFG